MAERTEYVIYIKPDEWLISDESNGTPDTAAMANGEEVSQKSEAKKASKNKKADKTKKVLVAGYGYAKRLIAPIATNAINTVSLRTGNDELQRRAQLAIDSVSAAADIGETVISGFLIGGGVGAAIGATVGIATKVINYEIGRYNYRLQKTVDDVSLAEARRRAGTSGDRIGKSY